MMTNEARPARKEDRLVRVLRSGCERVRVSENYSRGALVRERASGSENEILGS